MKTGEINRKTRIREALESAGKPLTLTEISKIIDVSSIKIGQSLNLYEFSIVRIGRETFDLPSRFYEGRSFRITPTAFEIEKGIIRADQELPIFIAANYNTYQPVSIVDEEKETYLIRTIKYAKTAPFEYYKGLKEWFKKQNFETGDDVVFTCLSYKNREYLIRKVKKLDRDEKLISFKNKILADTVFSVLSQTVYKYEDIMFLFRKYMFIFPYNDPTPPDSVFKALINDSRFVISTRDRIAGQGETTFPDWMVIGLSKYYSRDQEGNYILVDVLSDDYIKFGVCSLCENRMIWDPVTGWRHCVNENEWIESEIPPEFFKLGKPQNIKN